MMSNEKVIGDICLVKNGDTWTAIGDKDGIISITESNLMVKCYVVRLSDIEPLIFPTLDEAFKCVEDFVKMVMKK